MSKDYIGYKALVDAAQRGIVREALRAVEHKPLVGAHHFYLTFKTGFPGVDIPDFLREQYPDEMTIVLQHQYWGLKVEPDRFFVTLTFRKLPAELVIPFAALTSFVDPGVQFGLQFEAPASSSGTPPPRPKSPEPQPESPDKKDDKPETAGAVVSLDAFRKK